MRRAEICKAIDDYYNNKGCSPYIAEVPTIIYKELCQELGVPQVSHIYSVPVHEARGLSDDRIVLDGHGGQVVYPMMPPVPAGGQMPPSPNALHRFSVREQQLDKFMAVFLNQRHVQAKLVVVSPASFHDIQGGPMYSKAFPSGITYTCKSFQYAVLCAIPGTADDECLLFEDEHSTPVLERFVNYHALSGPVAPGVNYLSANNKITPIPTGGLLTVPLTLKNHSAAVDAASIDYAYPQWGLSASPSCECGSDKVGSPSHSSWCPKHG